jgi:hypothetical protein
MKKILMGLLILCCVSAYSATVTYNYTGPKAQIMISSELVFLEDCEDGCLGAIEIYFIPENYVTVSGPVEIFILLEALQGSSLEFVVTTKHGKHYALSAKKDENLFKVNRFFADYLKLQEISENYLIH